MKTSVKLEYDFKLSMYTDGDPPNGFNLDLYWDGIKREWVDPDQFFGRRQWTRPFYMIHLGDDPNNRFKNLVGKHGFKIGG